MVKNLPANAGDAGDTGLIPESGRSPGGGHATNSGVLAWMIPGTEELDRLQSIWGHRELDMTEGLTLLLHFAFPRAHKMGI